MSNSLGIATVTSSLRALLENAYKNNDNFDDSLPNALVTTVLPISVSSSGLPDVGANVFLFQVTPNAANRNSDLPIRDSQGNLISRPRVALDLHYLITFYGDDTVLEPQRLLGLTVRALNRTPVFSPPLIEQAISQLVTSHPELGFLDLSDLAAAVEPVRLTPIAMPVDELSRLWSLFSFQSKFSLSVVYMASVLFVDTVDATQNALPVTTTNVYVDAGVPPTIDSLDPAGDLSAPILPNAAISILGSGFGTSASNIQVLIDGVAAATTNVTPTEIDLTLPDLAAGVHGLTVARPRQMGTPPTPHQGLLSNLVPLVIQPVIDLSTPPEVTFVFTSPADPDDDPPPETIDGVFVVSGHLHLTVNPPVNQGQTVVITLNSVASASPPSPLSYTLSVDTSGFTSPQTALVARFKRVVPGTYLIRIQVDGSSSALTVDPGTGLFDGPTVEVTTP
ncbi:MAG TPA: DUF4255 domain-containing protein [Polyangia bacterium]|nr:DUF4255 domain-containing protein [Polyangia bacterium]